MGFPGKLDSGDLPALGGMSPLSCCTNERDLGLWGHLSGPRVQKTELK